MKLKNCPKCQQDLPLTSFTSTRAKYCNPCKRIHQLELQREMQQRAINKMQVKVDKKKKVIIKKKTVVKYSDLKKIVQRKFNAWIRERDKNQPCISCGITTGKMNAGHYIAQGSSGLLRYNEDNVHIQCVGCNRFKHGNLINYRIGLIAKIGEERVKWLEENRFKTYKWTHEELNELLEKYST